MYLLSNFRYKPNCALSKRTKCGVSLVVKQSDKKERYLSVAYVLSFFVGYLWEVVVSILPIESTALAVFIAVVGAAVSLLLAFAVYYPIM